jgi:hypothetical protein
MMRKEDFDRLENDHKFYQCILECNPEISKDLKEKFQMKSMIFEYEIEKREIEKRSRCSRVLKTFLLLFWTPIAIAILLAVYFGR